MIKNYLKVAFRNLWRHRGFSFINVMGLTVGMTAFFLIFLYVQFECSYDRFHSKGDRICRMVADLKTPTETLHPGGPAWAVGPHLTKELPEIEAAVRTNGENILIRRGDKKFQEEDAMYVDSAFFQVFDFPLLEGNPRTALNNPFSIVLSEKAAKKYFGKTDPIGQTLLISNKGDVATVTGVMKNIPENSIIQGEVLISMSTLTRSYFKGLDDQWGNYGSRTYVLLRPGANYKTVESKLPAFLDKLDGEEMRNYKMWPSLSLEPFTKVYLYSTREGNSAGNIKNVYTFSIIAVFILLIACFNFVNLTTARSAERAKEVGIRKVVGAGRGQLSRQFIGESIILCLIAYLLSVGLSAALLSLFNQLSGKTISPSIFTHAGYLLILLMISISIGILAGIYPALVLSSFQPIIVLKGRFVTGSKGILLRKSLVVAQFTISIALIIGTIIVYTQMKYMRSQDLGFSQDQKLIIETHNDPAKEAFKNAVATLPNVMSVSMSGSVPGGPNPGAYSKIENIKGDMQIANMDLYFVDFDYIPQYKMKVVAGRLFSKDFMTDTTNSMVVNETAVKDFGFTSPEQIIGRKFDQWGRRGTIIGVVKDFHFQSLQEVIRPLSFRIEPNATDIVSVQIAGGKDMPATISAIESKWRALIPDRPFSYYFLDEFFDKQYRAEDRFGRLFFYFSVLAIFISCLGLLGLASYSTMQRTKEIGIRKVLGASVGNIVNLLSKEFVILVGISFLVASPIAWYFMHEWLTGFAYRMAIGWWIFILAGVAALMIALFTVSFQAMKAALTNPTRSLRAE